MSNERERWESQEGQLLLKKVLRSFHEGGELDLDFLPRVAADMRINMRGLPLPDYLRLEGFALRDADLSNSLLRGARIRNSVFENVVFDKADLSGLVDFGNSFLDCSFIRTTFRNATFGYDGSQYRNCVFERCRFPRSSFIRAEFDDCVFDHLKGVDFGGSSFVNCVFKGKIDDVWFRGGFGFAGEEAEFGTPRKNKMENVSFAEASLWRLTLSNECDLSTVVVPAEGDYIMFDHWKERLEWLSHESEAWNDHERFETRVFVVSYLAHAQSQDVCLVNCDEVVGDFGDDVASKILATLNAFVPEGQ